MRKWLAVISLAVLGGCSVVPFPLPGSAPDTVSSEMGDTSRNALDWAGSYQALMPCADCEGILTTLTLAEDGNYQIKRLYLGEDDLLFDTSGRFTWSTDGRSISLDVGDAPDQYLVQENRLVQLDLDGNRVSGPLAEYYILYKVAEPDPLLTPVSFPLQGTRWELSALHGSDVSLDPAQQPWLLLGRDGNVTGFAGCNSFSGRYTQDGLRLRFTDLASTLRACVDPAMNDDLLEVLNNVDNFTRSSNTLSLNRARMAPLANFSTLR